MTNTRMTVEEVALLVGCSVKTINNWYLFKSLHPDNEYAKMLPNFIRNGPRDTRYWNKEEVWKIIEFRQAIPKGRNGILGDATQKYHKKGKIKNEQN